MKLINFIALFTLFSSIISIANNNPVISVIFLISTFLSAAIYLILIGIHFIGISYIIVYCGAIAVLFLFVILMLDIKLSDIKETGVAYRKTVPLGISIFILFVFIFFSSLWQGANFSENGLSSILYFITYLNYFILPAWQHKPYFSSEFLNLFETGNTSLIDAISKADIIFQDIQQIQALGFSLYTYGAVWLIILSLVLLFSMFATIVISLDQKNKV